MGSAIKAKMLFLKQGWGKLWVILNQISAWTIGCCSPLPLLPSSSSKSQGYLLTNNPWHQQDGAPGHCGHENAHQETSCVGGGGKGCMVWDQLRPSSPRPALKIFSVGHSVGHPAPNCPLPWADICLLKEVLQGLCCDTACTLGAVGMSPLSGAPCNGPRTLLSSIPKSCWCHKSVSALEGDNLAECLP